MPAHKCLTPELWLLGSVTKGSLEVASETPLPSGSCRNSSMLSIVSLSQSPRHTAARFGVLLLLGIQKGPLLIKFENKCSMEYPHLTVNEDEAEPPQVSYTSQRHSCSGGDSLCLQDARYPELRETNIWKQGATAATMFKSITLKLKRKPSVTSYAAIKKSSRKSGKGQVKLFRFPHKRTGCSSEEIVVCVKTRHCSSFHSAIPLWLQTWKVTNPESHTS